MGSAPLSLRVRANMEYSLIVAVSGFPSLYDSSSPTYRDLNTRSDSWRQVAQIVGVPGEVPTANTGQVTVEAVPEPAPPNRAASL